MLVPQEHGMYLLYLHTHKSLVRCSVDTLNIPELCPQHFYMRHTEEAVQDACAGYVDQPFPVG